jgi:hypothetical protein
LRSWIDKDISNETITGSEKDTEIFEFNLLLGEIASIYREEIGNQKICIDEVSLVQMEKLSWRLIKLLDRIKNITDKNDTKDSLGLAKYNHNKWRFWISISYIWEELSESISGICWEEAIINNWGGHWDNILWYVDKMWSFKYEWEYFDLETLEKNHPEELKCLKKMVKTYRSCLTLRDRDEKNTKTLDCNWSLAEIKRFSSWFVGNYKDIKWYYDKETREVDIKNKKEAIKNKDVGRMIYLTWLHAKKFFLRFFLEKGIISRWYYLYLNTKNDPWEALKELYYISARWEIWENILKSTPEDIINNIRALVVEALEREPKESYRLLYSLENIIELYAKQVELLSRSWIWIKMYMPTPTFSLPERWEKVILIDSINITEH